MPTNTPLYFDQYQRYQFIAKLIECITPETETQILEVGAAYSPLRQLLSHHRCLLLDQTAGLPGLDLRGSGLRLPFQDLSFPITVSTDVLEHLNEVSRSTFINELQRVSSQSVILGFPFKNSLNDQADQGIFDFFKSINNADFEYLCEHIRHGLPDADEVRRILQPCFSEIYEFGNANLYSWFVLQAVQLLLAKHPDLQNASQLFHESFNRYFAAASHDEPFYRRFFVCFKEKASPEVKGRLESIRDTTRAGQVHHYAATSFALAAAVQEPLSKLQLEKQQLLSENSRLSGSLSSLEASMESLQKEFVDQESKIQHWEAKSENLQHYLNLFLQHPVYKIYRSLKTIFGRLLPVAVNNGHTVTSEANYRLFQQNIEPSKTELFRQSHAWHSWPSQPSLNIVTAVYSPPVAVFEEAIHSVLNQTYGRWVWTIVDASIDDSIWQILTTVANRDSRVRPVRLNRNLGISGNMNVALQRSEGDYIVFLDHDDTLAPHALFSVAELLLEHPEAEFIYSDADKLDESGQRCEPFFKPDWSPEMMLSLNLLNQLSVFKRQWLMEVGYLNSELDGAQDWDLFLRITEKTPHVFHIPRILYHWRKIAGSTAASAENKSYARQAQIRALKNHLTRCGIQNANVEFDPHHPIYRVHPRVRWRSSIKRLVSIIIPTKDRPDLLERCLKSLFHFTSACDYEVMLVDTGSIESATKSLYDRYLQEGRVRLLEFHEPFNFGKACNFGAVAARGELLLFLNNDTEFLHEGWLERMVQWFDRENVAIVGAKLLYPNGRIQHAGVIVGMGGLASHLFLNEKEEVGSIFGVDAWYRNVSAVTGACLLISREVFQKLNGFDEEFQLNYSDVDLCLRAREAGYRIVYTPDARVLHHEAATHQRRVPRSDFELANKKWRSWFEKGDPFFNENLSYGSSLPLFRRTKQETLISLNTQFMQRLPQKHIILPEDLV